MNRILKRVGLVQAILESKKRASLPLAPSFSAVGSQANPIGQRQAGFLGAHYELLAFWAMRRYRHTLTPDQVWLLLLVDEFLVDEGQKALPSGYFGDTDPPFRSYCPPWRKRVKHKIT